MGIICYLVELHPIHLAWDVTKVIEHSPSNSRVQFFRHGMRMTRILNIFPILLVRTTLILGFKYQLAAIDVIIKVQLGSFGWSSQELNAHMVS